MLDGWVWVENTAARIKRYKRRKRKEEEEEERDAGKAYSQYGKFILITYSVRLIR